MKIISSLTITIILITTTFFLVGCSNHNEQLNTNKQNEKIKIYNKMKESMQDLDKEIDKDYKNLKIKKNEI